MIPQTAIAGSETDRLHRPRLLRRLYQHRHRRLTLVVAPPGFGKTTLLRNFSQGAPFPVCWLSLSSAHTDTLTFVEHLVATLTCPPRQTFLTKVRQDFAARTLSGRRQGGQHFVAAGRTTGCPSQRDLPALVDAFLQDLMAYAPEPFVLILDDYHALDDAWDANDFLGRFLLSHPGHCHTIVSSRTEPTGLPLLQLAARSQLAGIGPRHLAFTPQEVQAWLAQRHNLSLSLAQAKEIAAESGGWIAGIRLATRASGRGIRDSLAQTQIRAALPELSLSPLSKSNALFSQAWQTLSQQVKGDEGVEESRGVRCPSRGGSPPDARALAPPQEPHPRLDPGALSGPADSRDARGDGPLRVGDLTIDVPRRSVKRGERTIVLTAREFDLLAYLARRRNRVVSHQELLEQIWEYPPGCHTPKVVRTTVSRLRQKLGENPAGPRYIATVRGVGYRVSLEISA